LKEIFFVERVIRIANSGVAGMPRVDRPGAAARAYADSGRATDKEPRMKAIKSLVVAAIAAIGIAGITDAAAARGASSGAGSHVGGGHSGGHWSGGGHSGGHWNGGHRNFGYYGGRFYGGYYPYWGWAWPLAWSAAYWPYYGYDYYYPRAYVERYPAPYPDGVMEPSAEAPRSEGAPTQGPAYRNYCESAKAYYPKVASCAEGWKFIPAR
jgi:hypothetical protein